MTAPPLLTEEHVEFITSEVSISAASRDVRRVPSLCKVIGCRVSDDRRRVTVLVDGPANARLLADVRATQAIAVVYSLPSTHRTMQLKGSDATIEDIRPGDPELAKAHCRAFCEHLVNFGYPRGFAQALHDCPPDHLVAIAFTVGDAFAQTPGPGAGSRMER